MVNPGHVLSAGTASRLIQSGAKTDKSETIVFLERALWKEQA